MEAFMRYSARAFLLLVAVLFVPACGTQKRKNPPVVVFTSPSSGASSVPRQPIIYIRYDKPLDPSTVDSGHFILADSVGVIPCAVSYNANLFHVRIIPNTAIGNDTAARTPPARPPRGSPPPRRRPGAAHPPPH